MGPLVHWYTLPFLLFLFLQRPTPYMLRKGSKMEEKNPISYNAMDETAIREKSLKEAIAIVEDKVHHFEVRKAM